jgi:outer membrane protein assembly factor BamB
MRKRNWMLIILIYLILLQSLILITSSASASSSADEWVMFRHDPSHSGYTTANGSTNSAKLLWNFTTMKAVASSPAVANGTVFAASKDSGVYSINASNGELLWFYPTGGEVKSSPAVIEGTVYVGSYDGNVYALNASDGSKLWNYTTGNEVESSPSVVDNVVYVSSRDSNVYALNASDGSKLWNSTIDYEVFSSPAVSNGVVYIAAHDFHVYALNASTGSQMWRRHTGSVSSSPTVQNGSVYIGSYDGYVSALNASTGDKIWEYLTEGSVYSSPAVAYGFVYIGSDDNNVYCLNATNGEKIWQSPTGYWVRSSPAVAEGNVYVGSEDYNIYCFDAFTGAKKWSFQTGNYVDSSPAISNGTLYVGSYDNNVYAFTLYNSTVDDLPSQSDSVTWTTIAFDAITGFIVAAIISVIVLFIQTNRRTKHNAEDMSVPSQKVPWFSAHADTLCVLAILAFSAIFFINLGSGHLWATDEQTYSQWAFHMFKSGDYMTPWARGEVLMVIAKPPLYMWLMSLSFQVFGVNNFAARFWSPIFGALSLVVVFFLGKNLYNSRVVGFLSAVVLGTFTTFYVFARHAMLDVTLVFFILASIYFLVLSDKRESANTYAALSGLFFGLAFMTKQVAAFLIPLIAFGYFTMTGRIRVLFTKRFALFLGVGILVFSPWLIYMILTYGSDFWESFFVFSGIMRASTPIEGHVGGYFFYFSYLVNNENLLWVVLVPFAAGLSVFNSLRKHAEEDILILTWMLTVILLFTFVQSKLEWYILPAFPAFAIAISSFLHQLSKKIKVAIRLLASQALRIVEMVTSRKQR